MSQLRDQAATSGTDLKAPIPATGGTVDETVKQVQTSFDRELAPEKQPEAIVSQQAGQNREELEKQAAELQAEIDRQTATKTPQGGTVATNEPKPETTIPAGPQTVKVSSDTILEMEDGSKVPWKQVKGERIMGNEISKEKRAIHDAQQTLNQERQQIEKVKASPLMRTLIAGAESGHSDEKLIEAGAALIGKQIAQPAPKPEPPVPSIESPTYEKDMLERQKWERERDNAPLLAEIAGLRQTVESLRPQEVKPSIGDQNGAILDSVMNMPSNLNEDQKGRIRQYLVATGARIGVNVDPFSVNNTLLNKDQVLALRYAAFPDDKIPAHVLNPVDPPPPLPKEVGVVHLEKLQAELNEKKRELGLLPPLPNQKPISEAGGQPAALPGDGRKAQVDTGGEISDRDARSRVANFTSGLRAK